MQPIQVLHGNETYLIDENRVKLIRKTIGEIDEFNFAAFDMEETPVEIGINEAETLSFMGGHRVVILKNAMFLTGSDKSKVEHNLDRLIDYINNPNELTTLILTVPSEKLDGRKKVVKELKKKADIKVCNALPAHQLRPFIREKVKENGAIIEPEAIERLILLLGGNLHSISMEIEKIALYAQNQVINEQMVTNMVSRNVDQNVFILVDHIVKKQLKEAHMVLMDLIRKKEEPIKILALLVSKFRLILQVSVLTKKGWPLQKVAKELGVHPYPVQLAAEQASNFEENDLIQLISEITTLDYQMKTGQVDKVLGLEQLLCKIGI